MCSSDFSLLPRVEAKRYNGSASFTDGVAECLLLNELSFSVDVVLVGEVPRYIYAYIYTVDLFRSKNCNCKKGCFFKSLIYNKPK